MDLKNKLLEIYLSVYEFVNNYHPIFNEIIFSEGNAVNKNHEIVDTIYENMKKFIEAEILKGNIKVSIPPDKIGYMIIQNFIYMSRDKILTFDEFYTSFNI